MIIKSFNSKALAVLYNTGKVSPGMDPKAAKKMKVQISAIKQASNPNDLRGMWDTHELKPKYPGYWSMDVIGQWRLTFRFDPTDGSASELNYIDYHGKSKYKL